LCRSYSDVDPIPFFGESNGDSDGPLGRKRARHDVGVGHSLRTTTSRLDQASERCCFSIDAATSSASDGSTTISAMHDASPAHPDSNSSHQEGSRGRARSSAAPRVQRLHRGYRGFGTPGPDQAHSGPIREARPGHRKDRHPAFIGPLRAMARPGLEPGTPRSQAGQRGVELPRNACT